jgi:hypothetical protein
MPTNRRKVPPRRINPLSAMEWRVLMDVEEPPAEEGGESFERLLRRLDYDDEPSRWGPGPRELWAAHRDMVLPLWVREHPGTRPRLWWLCDAPELRRRLGGTGMPIYEVFGYTPCFDHGVPDHWLQQSDVDCYRNHMKPPIYITAPAYDPDDPPVFESEAAYLDRHGLLLPGERRRLRDENFEPVRVELAGWSE